MNSVDRDAQFYDERLSNYRFDIDFLISQVTIWSCFDRPAVGLHRKGAIMPSSAMWARSILIGTSHDIMALKHLNRFWLVVEFWLYFGHVLEKFYVEFDAVTAVYNLRNIDRGILNIVHHTVNLGGRRI